MKVVALAPYPQEAPSTRFRLSQFRGYLAASGVELEILPFLTPEEFRDIYRSGGVFRKGALLGKALRRRGHHLELAAEANLVVVHRELAPLLPGYFLGRLRAAGVPYLFDFDDAVFLPARGGNPVLQRLRRPGPSTARLCRGAALVLAGNEYLADFARQARVGVDEGVKVLPTVIDTDAYRPPDSPRGRPGADLPGRKVPVVGWIGTHSTLPYLEGIAEALARAAEQTPFRLLVVSNREPSMGPGLDVSFRPWSLTGEVADLHAMDVGVYPVPDDEWTLGKCGFKAIQFMACGIPVVASPVGVLREIVSHGATGFHAGSVEEWTRGLSRLLRSPAERGEMGLKGRARAVEAYSLAFAAPRLLAWMEEVAS